VNPLAVGAEYGISSQFSARREFRITAGSLGRRAKPALEQGIENQLA
jgi:hypothetical protein